MTDGTAAGRGEPERTVVTVTGDIDLVSRDELIASVDAVLGRCSDRIVLDLSGVPFIDCAGLTGILRARERAAGHRCRVALGERSHPVQRLLELTDTLALLAEP